MKITLDIPDNTVGMTVVLLSGDWCGLTMHNEGIPQRKLTDGTFLGNWKRMYKRMSKISYKEEQDAFLKTEMDKIFGEDGYPYEFIDSLEKRGDA